MIWCDLGTHGNTGLAGPGSVLMLQRGCGCGSQAKPRRVPDLVSQLLPRRRRKSKKRGKLKNGNNTCVSLLGALASPVSPRMGSPGGRGLLTYLSTRRQASLFFLITDGIDDSSWDPMLTCDSARPHRPPLARARLSVLGRGPDPALDPPFRLSATFIIQHYPACQPSPGAQLHPRMAW